jgi:pimeloyl-ACP methyl ester carboxylesterase
MTVTNLDHEPELIASFDSTVIAARRMGAADGTPLLIANGIGANLAAWRRALVDVGRERPIVTWDHRGLHASGPPQTDRLEAGAHAEDGMAAVDHFDVDRFLLASWSTGSRIALEIAHRYPERVEGLVIVCGGYGHSLRHLFPYLELAALLPLGASVVKYFSGPLAAALRAFASRAELPGLLRQSGMLAATADTSAAVELLRGMAECDMRLLLASYEAVAGNAAPSLLGSIEAPTLLVAGERDPFISSRVMRQMNEAIPTARLETYERATHYLPIEYPARLSDDLRKFFAELGA